MFFLLDHISTVEVWPFLHLWFVCFLSIDYFVFFFLTKPGSFWIFLILFFCVLSYLHIQSSFLVQLFGFVAIQLCTLLFFVPSIVCCFGKQSLRYFRLVFFALLYFFSDLTAHYLFQIKRFGNQAKKVKKSSPCELTNPCFRGVEKIDLNIPCIRYIPIVVSHVS